MYFTRKLNLPHFLQLFIKRFLTTIYLIKRELNLFKSFEKREGEREKKLIKIWKEVVSGYSRENFSFRFLFRRNKSYIYTPSCRIFNFLIVEKLSFSVVFAVFLQQKRRSEKTHENLVPIYIIQYLIDKIVVFSLCGFNKVGHLKYIISMCQSILLKANYNYLIRNCFIDRFFYAKF